MVFINFLKDERFEFERTYSYDSELFPNYSEQNKKLEGFITFHGEVYWDNSSELFDYELYSSGSEEQFESKNFPGYDELEQRFLDEYKDYLLSQGVPLVNIAWL